MAKMKTQEEKEEVTSRRFDLRKAIKVLVDEKKYEESSNKEQSKAKATLLKMKELIRWAAATKSDKTLTFLTPKIMELIKKRKLKMMREMKEEVKSRNESAKMSFRSDSGSSNTSFSSNDHITIVSLGLTPTQQCRTRKANWIMTDSESVKFDLKKTEDSA